LEEILSQIPFVSKNFNYKSDMVATVREYSVLGEKTIA
jgi:hypothetical protein